MKKSYKGSRKARLARKKKVEEKVVPLRPGETPGGDPMRFSADDIPFEVATLRAMMPNIDQERLAGYLDVNITPDHMHMLLSQPINPEKLLAFPLLMMLPIGVTYNDVKIQRQRDGVLSSAHGEGIPLGRWSFATVELVDRWLRLIQSYAFLDREQALKDILQEDDAAAIEQILEETEGEEEETLASKLMKTIYDF